MKPVIQISLDRMEVKGYSHKVEIFNSVQEFNKISIGNAFMLETSFAMNGHTNSKHEKNQPWSRIWNGSSATNLAKWTLYCGDAVEVLRTFPSEYVSCTVTSPPYFWQRDYEVAGQIGVEKSLDGYVESICAVMDEVRRVLAPSGVLFLNLGDTYYSAKGQPHGKDPKHNGRRFKTIRAVDASGMGLPRKTMLGMPWRVALEMIDRGWILRAPIIWQRKAPIPEPNVRDRPWRTYEFVFLFAKSPKYQFTRDALISADVEDIWTIESRPKAGRVHPAVFPSELVRRCLELGNSHNGLVLDPFAGSGTVLRVAMEMGASSIGIDLNQNFCKTAMKDLQSIAGD